MDRVQKKLMSVNFGHAVFSLLYTRDNMAMHNLVLLHMVQFSVFWFGALYSKFGMTSHI
jgi:hypothetical protein